MPSDSRLTLLTLGGWGLSYASAGQALTPIFGPSKPTALLVYLAVAPGRTARREHLLDLLWADLDPDSAGHALRQTIWYIRQRTAPGVIESVNGSLRLAAPVDLDRDRFLEAVAQMDMEAAVALYAGDFLPGFAAPGGAEFEKWADLERHRLRTAFIRCAEEVCHRHLAASHFREAVALARRVRDADPMAEPGWRLLLETLASANDRIGLAAEADALEQMLTSEEREPDPATGAALRAARQAPADAPSRETQLVAELIGREREFGAIIEAWQAAQRGRVQHIHLTAAAGLGKTRLLTDAYHRLRASGARAVLLRANPGERQVPFAFAADLAAGLARLPGATGVPPAIADALVGLNPSLSDRFPNARSDRAAGSDAIRLRTIALEETLRAAAEDAPVALLVDDAHWMDPASAQVFAGLVTRIERERVLVASTARPTGETTPGRGDSLHYVLVPLDPVQVGALLASLGTLPDADWTREFASRLHAATRGFPLLLIETLQLALDRGALTLSGGAWGLGDAAALRTILATGSALRRRVEELGRDQRWLLLVLATAGRVIALDTFRDVSPRPDDSLLEDLRDMERRGLARSVAGGWLPGHDAVAETAVELATDEARHAAHAALGKAYARWAPAAPALIPLAAQHLVAAGDLTSVEPMLRLAIRHAASRGDHRRNEALAHELLGEHGTADRVRALTRMLPMHYRVGITTPARTAAVAAVAIVATAAGAWSVVRPAPPPPDATLILRLTDQDGTARYRRVPFRLSDWHGGAEQPLETLGEPVTLPASVALAESEGRPGWFVDMGPSFGWLMTLAFPDSGGQDIAIADTSGHLRRLTSNPGDDTHGSLSPDRRFMVFSTSAWNHRMMYDLAVMDLRTREVRQLTSGNDHDHLPLWSADGTRIAFTRTYQPNGRGERPIGVCVMGVDTSGTRCFLPDSATNYNLLQWRDSVSLLVNRFGTGRMESGTVNVRTGAYTLLMPSELTTVSPDGRLAIRQVSNEATGVTDLVVFPIGDPEAGLTLRRSAATTAIAYGWQVPALTGYVAALTTDAPATLHVGIPYRLRVRARLADGRLTVPAIRTFASADPGIADVDSSGTIIPRRAGATTIRVSAGGWRDTTVTVRVAPPPAVTDLLTERWEGDYLARWHFYGYPRPQVVEAAGRPAFWNAGEGNYDSGAYTLQDYDAREGLGMEATASTPLDSGQWQQISLRFSSMIDTIQVKRWNDRSGWLPANLAQGVGRECQFMFPASYSASSLDSGIVGLGESGRDYVRMPGFSRGAWFRIRLQLFPDGRCGLAINGRAVMLGHARLDLSHRYRANVYGNSAWTRILVGPVQVWQGVKTDVDWTRLEP